MTQCRTDIGRGYFSKGVFRHRKSLHIRVHFGLVCFVESEMNILLNTYLSVSILSLKYSCGWRTYLITERWQRSVPINVLLTGHPWFHVSSSSTSFSSFYNSTISRFNLIPFQLRILVSTSFLSFLFFIYFFLLSFHPRSVNRNQTYINFHPTTDYNLSIFSIFPSCHTSYFTYLASMFNMYFL